MNSRTKFYLMLLALYTAGLLAFSSFACESDSPAREEIEQPTHSTDVHLAEAATVANYDKSHEGGIDHV